MSSQMRDVRAQMEEDENLRVLMQSLRGSNLNDADFAGGWAPGPGWMSRHLCSAQQAAACDSSCGAFYWLRRWLNGWLGDTVGGCCAGCGTL